MLRFTKLFVLTPFVAAGATGCIDAHHAVPTTPHHAEAEDADHARRPPMPAHSPAHAVRGHWTWDTHREEWGWREEH